MSDEFVGDAEASIAVPFAPPEHNAVQSDSGVTSSENAVDTKETAATSRQIVETIMFVLSTVEEAGPERGEKKMQEGRSECYVLNSMANKLTRPMQT
ncbi:hypothetical protein ColLi_04889 [Colletotrichum liriopes]|uniref:Uncharacterized protein n=1 Tax=Colletotrichum liriopes TaxID=708192 RepID=A0AA37GJA7_9PEZI|nr:hypothetical protein ColLi_04889 [Colletotrichum liriopes]